MIPADLNIAELQAGYAAGRFTPRDVAEAVIARCATHLSNPIWITRVANVDLRARADALNADSEARVSLPLYGIPFAVKDNIDAAGYPTTAACPEFAYTPAQSATVVQQLIDAGAMLVGKTNLDQFATGLVGVRSPYGAVQNAINSDYISGGSSSGSGVAVGLGLVSFSLGTDTAGSGRVPAGFNNIVGLKPTRGLISAAGVVPACKSIDCVSIFARTAADCITVLDVLDHFDVRDSFARTDRAPQHGPSFEQLRLGVPNAASREFFGDHAYAQLFDTAIEHATSLGATIVEIDLAPFLEAARMLYDGPWVAERYAAIRPFFERAPDAIHPIVRAIIGGADRYSAADAFAGIYRMAELRRATAPTWHAIDALLVPTAGTIYRRDAVEADPIRLNANLGRYTNFVNFMDLAAIAVPAGFRADGLPFGVTFIAPACTDRWLAELGARWTGHEVPAATARLDLIRVAVVGAHLSGQSLNHQLTRRGAQLVAKTHTAPDYNFYALADETPPKPGLIRVPPGSGHAIELEVWQLSAAGFGAFVAAIPAPLGIGMVKLASGESVKGFICEAYAIVGKQDISKLGGWRAYLASRKHST